MDTGHVNGNRLNFNFGEGVLMDKVISAKIVQTFEPFTLSSVILIDDINEITLQKKAPLVLKIFDRRFASALREQNYAQPWDSTIEDEYKSFVVNGGMERCQKKWKNTEHDEREWDEGNTGETEAYLYYLMQEHYESERKVYQKIRDMQGSDGPEFYGCVTFQNVHADYDPKIAKYREFRGVLLQYIQGFPLTEIQKHVDRKYWQSLCEEAINIVRKIGSEGILNEDVSTRNHIVRRQDCGYKVYMIDFGLCDFEENYPDKQLWRRLKAFQDEEGAIGLVMQRRLEGAFVYEMSEEYKKLDAEFINNTI